MIEVVKVKDRDEGNLRARDIIKNIVDSQTLLALSGGTSPDYRKMIVEPATPLRSARQSFEGQSIMPGAICVVDERYGEPFHKDSNELLLQNAQVFDFAQKNSIELHKILCGREILETEKEYDKTIIDLFGKFSKKVGVMGVGANLHTAGVFPYSAAVKAPDFVVAETVEDKFPQRITLTLRALGEFANFVILAFGPAKQDALRVMLDEKETDMQKYPAIFYRKCFAKSWLITDQEV